MLASLEPAPRPVRALLPSPEEAALLAPLSSWSLPPLISKSLHPRTRESLKCKTGTLLPPPAERAGAVSVDLKCLTC